MSTCQVKVSLTGRLLTEETLYLSGTFLTCPVYYMYLPGLACTCQAYSFTCQAFASGLPARFILCLSGILLLLYLELQAAHADLATFARPSMAKSLTIPRRPSCAPLTHITTVTFERLPCCHSPSPAVPQSPSMVPALTTSTRYVTVVTSPTPPRHPSLTPCHFARNRLTLTRHSNGETPRGVQQPRPSPHLEEA